MNENIERKNVEWKYDEYLIDRRLVIRCPRKGNGDLIEMSILINELCAPEQFNQLVRFLYKAYPEIFWEYVEWLKGICINDRFCDEILVKFLIEIIPDIFPDCHFSIDLTKMPKRPKNVLYEKDNVSTIEEPIEVEVDNIDSIKHGDAVEIEQIINWLQKKTGFNVAVTNYSIKRNIKVKGIK